MIRPRCGRRYDDHDDQIIGRKEPASGAFLPFKFQHTSNLSAKRMSINGFAGSRTTIRWKRVVTTWEARGRISGLINIKAAAYCKCRRGGNDELCLLC